MSWDTEFYAAVVANTDFNAAVGDNFSYEYKPDAATPFATYQLISTVGTDDLEGHGREGERRIQLSVWALSPTQAKEIAEYAIVGVQASTLNLHSVFDRSLGRQSDQEIHGYAVDFLIWFDTP